MNTTIRRKTNTRRAGTVTVEAALVLPLLLTLLFGIIEFGFIFKDLMLLHQGAREGARVAAVGAIVDNVISRAEEGAPTLNSDALDVVVQYRTFGGTNWSNWTQLDDYQGENNAPGGSQIRVTLSYPHPLAAGPFFSRLIGNPGATSIPLTSSMVMYREQ
jgi:Flp pilus assembly protein TadG